MRFCRILFRGISSPVLSTVHWQHSVGGWRTDAFCLPVLSQRLLTAGSMMCFPIHKGYYGSLHITKEYQSLNGSNCINARPPRVSERFGLNLLFILAQTSFVTHYNYTISCFLCQDNIKIVNISVYPFTPYFTISNLQHSFYTIKYQRKNICVNG